VQRPEEIELDKNYRVLERLKDRLADNEEEMAEIRAELEQFETNYKMQVGRLYAELDEIDAEIAEEEVKLNPEDAEIKKRAEEARERAAESAEEAARAEEIADNCTFKWQPTTEAKKAYHSLAKMIHPDLALNAEERERRHALMAELNKAYEAGDQGKLNKLVDDYRDSPDLIIGDSIGDELVRTIRQIYQVRSRLKELRVERLTAELSELYMLKEKIRSEQLEGRNLLDQMAERTRSHILKAKRRLENLRKVNEANSDEYHEMNVSMFN
jgi:hypothetical protein